MSIKNLFLNQLRQNTLFTCCRSNPQIVVWQTVENPTYFAILNQGIGFYDGDTLDALEENNSFSGSIMPWDPQLPTPAPADLRNKIRNPKILTITNEEDCTLLIQTLTNFTPRPFSESLPSSSAVSQNLILYGPPGTGKTYRIIYHAVEAIDPDFYQLQNDNRKTIKSRFDVLRQNKQIEFVTFHPGFAYEEFIEGITATTVNGQIAYSVKNGIFKRFCLNAASRPDERFVFIIDEINRGNVARIFGELITLIEENKRSSALDALSTQLPYSKQRFAVPSNVWLLGTMNTADRSLTQLDTALRRRFAFMAINPDTTLLADVEVAGIPIKPLVDVINARLVALLDEDHQLGVSYFLPLINEPTFTLLRSIFIENILPQLSEYFYNDLERVGLVLNDPVKPESQRFVIEKHVSAIFDGELPPGIPSTKFELNPLAIDDIEAYRAIAEVKDHD